MNRRAFLLTSGAAVAGTWLGRVPLLAAPAPRPGELRLLLQGLLRDWGEALCRLQIDEPANAARHGALRCPACDFLHGRCFDAIDPLLQLAAQTGRMKYRDAALRLFEWSRNVDAPDGAWTNDLDPKSWKGTTVFAATALAEALLEHGALLDAETRARWIARLRPAAEFIHRHVDLAYGNINYGFSALLALALLGRVLDEPKYAARARELARGAAAFLDTPNALLFGEGRPAERLSPQGARPVDLGYNVEESLPAAIHYAQLEGDDVLLRRLTQSALSHVEFMLPDGAWDNSWGTRSFKWTYWGGRTSDGCHAGFLRLAAQHPVLAVAAWRNAQLLRACTHDGLLHGGPHYASHVVAPCVHHTFSHAKSVARALRLGPALDRLDLTAPLPRALARGVREFPELATRLVAQGPWRATFTTYDWLYQPRALHATGGALALLWHERGGALFAASQAEFHPIERTNLQAPPDGEDFPLTPRVELMEDGRRFATSQALDARLHHETLAGGGLLVRADTRLAASNGDSPGGGPIRCGIEHEFHGDAVMIRARIERPASRSGGGNGAAAARVALVLPVIAARSERVTRVSAREFVVRKRGGVMVALRANAPLHVLPSRRDRVFASSPGFEAVPLAIEFGAAADPVECVITIRS